MAVMGRARNLECLIDRRERPTLQHVPHRFGLLDRETGKGGNLRFTTLRPSRTLSRSRMAGGERLLGTMSIYMSHAYAIRDYHA